jgi:hypothetical protein
MKIDRAKLEELCALGDEELWRTVRGLAAQHGFNLPESTPSKDEMARMRAAVSGTKINLAEAAKLLNEYRRSKS